jgi:hypothetical protein
MTTDEEFFDIVEHFKTDPMLAWEFLDIHEEINTPWFHVCFCFCTWRQRVLQWLGWERRSH